jgi:hypothetical protein
MSHVLMSTIWDVIPYQHLCHNSWPLCFLIPHLVPINIYLCSLVIFVGVVTTKVPESCSFRSKSKSRSRSWTSPKSSDYW